MHFVFLVMYQKFTLNIILYAIVDIYCKGHALFERLNFIFFCDTFMIFFVTFISFVIACNKLLS